MSEFSTVKLGKHRTGAEDKAMNVTTISAAVTGYSDTNAANDGLPVRSSHTDASTDVHSTQVQMDHFTPSSARDQGADGVNDTFTLTSLTGPILSHPSREARVANVIASVQNGTYVVRPKAVANAIVTRMVNQTDETTRDLP